MSRIIELLIAAGFLAFAAFLLFHQPEVQAATSVPIRIALSSGTVSAALPADTETVGSALSLLGINTERSLVSPPASAPLSPNLTVTITPTRTVNLYDGGSAPTVLISAAETVGDALVTESITLSPLDRVEPGAAAALFDGMTITITRVTEATRTETVPVPYDTLHVDDAAMLWASEELISPGKDGSAKETVRLRYVNDELASRTVLSYNLSEAPIAKEVRRGTKIVVEEIEEGGGSWYAYKDCNCAAHNRYPRGTWIRVTSLLDGKQVIVETNDWGPDPSVHPDRVIDLDAVAFKQLAPLSKGVIPVRAERIKTQ